MVKGEDEEGGEYDGNTSYTCMEIDQGNWLKLFKRRRG
jgi:hypothetical protein